MLAYFKKVIPEDNCFRFYEVSIEDDFFAERSLTVRWGRIGKPGSMRIKGSGSPREMRDLAASIAKLRLKKGYTRVT